MTLGGASVQAELFEPSEQFRVSFQAMAEELLSYGDERYAASIENFEDYLENLRGQAAGSNLQLGYVPCSTYWLVSSSEVIGCSRLRHELTPSLELEGGHIGYDIRLSRRRRGFGSLILELTLERARARGMSRVCITCDSSNLASVRVIEKNGGAFAGGAVSEFSGQPVRQYWIRL